MRKPINNYPFVALSVLLAVILLSLLKNRPRTSDAAKVAEAEERSRLSDSAYRAEDNQIDALVAPSVEDLSGKRVVLADIPEGEVRSMLMTMPPDLQNEVLAKITELDIPENDFDSLRLHPGRRLRRYPSV